MTPMLEKVARRIRGMSETVEVPFNTVGNRRCLTDEQLAAEPWVRDFVRRFPHSFEYDANRSIWWFVEPSERNP